MFRTEISHIHTVSKIDLDDQVLTLGSCFAENIGKRLDKFKFNVITNPGGILFNPISIFESILMALDDEELPIESYVLNESVHYNYKFHSAINGNTKAELDAAIDQARFKVKDQITNSDYLIITFGTAWIYELIDTNLLAANCHKVTQKKFSKRLLTASEIQSKFSELKKALQKHNPDLKILLTVSPIRHTREGLPNNGVSKAILRMVCHELSQNFKLVNYFPAYEIMMDDLRDYRFYEKDMIHPNEQAQDYIWDFFRKNYLSDSALKFTSDWQQIINAMEHRPFQPNSNKHQLFLKSTLEKVKQFSTIVNTENEIDQIKKQII
jgi:lysophospholipase L1-like esterase